MEYSVLIEGINTDKIKSVTFYNHYRNCKIEKLDDLHEIKVSLTSDNAEVKYFLKILKKIVNYLKLKSMTVV